MTWSPSNPIGGAGQSGFTSPTYTYVEDATQFLGAKQYSVSALGGTQAGVTASSISSPFTITVKKPSVLKALPAPNPVTGARGSIPMNSWQWIFRKGGEVASGIPATAILRCTIDVPAGMDSYSPAQVKALLSIAFGVLNAEAIDIADSVLTGVL